MLVAQNTQWSVAWEAAIEVAVPEQAARTEF